MEMFTAHPQAVAEKMKEFGKLKSRDWDAWLGKKAE